MNRNNLLLFLMVLVPALSVPAGQARPSSSQPLPAGKAAVSTAGESAGSQRQPSKRKARPESAIGKSPEAQRTKEMFRASAGLRPLANQLLRTRSAAAYAAVEAFASDHAQDNAGALAWLVVGYSRLQDGARVQAVDALRMAQPQAGVVGDYVDYFLASAYRDTGNPEAVIAVLKEFESRYPGSLFRDDVILMNAAALQAAGRLKDAIAFLEAHRDPLRADVELAVARAYGKANETGKAAEAFRRVYYAMPLTEQAEEAASELKTIESAKRISPPTSAQRRQRADLLAEGRRYNDAIELYKSLLEERSLADRSSVQLVLGATLFRARKYQDAREVLEKVPEVSVEANAERLYYLAELTRSRDAERYRQYMAELRSTAPSSPWMEEALLSAANSQLLQRNYEAAAGLYLEAQKKVPQGKRASYTLWKGAWLKFRLGQTDKAARLFEQLIRQYPGSLEVSAAVYWRGRLAEEENNLPRARAYYQKLSARFRHYYYAELARERLKAIGIDGSVPQVPVLRLIREAEPPEGFKAAPLDDVRAQKSRLLKHGALDDYAIRELQAAASGGANWAVVELIRLYQGSARHVRALQVAKRSIPGYLSFALADLPRPLWEALFPLAYWEDLNRFAVENNLDPYMVAALIRQESEFHPGAVSRARAIGLMQVMPATGRNLAREMKIKHFNSAKLKDPQFNLQLGTRYLRDRLDEFGGTEEYALASYNAGPERVRQWLADGSYRDIHEFVESIPFTETREYVQAVKRNVILYRRLYGAADLSQQASTGSNK